MNLRHRICLLFVLSLLALSPFSQTLGQQLTITLDGSSSGRTFEGLGAASAGASSRLLIDYPEPQRSQILDYLFKPGYGASLQRLKVEIGADVNSTDGSEPSHMRTASDHNSTRGYEWWLMAEAYKRNPKIILEVLPWGAPRWVGAKVNDKDTVYGAAMAGYVVDFIRTAKRDYGLDIAYTGIWNEREYNIAYIKQLHRLLQAEHLPTRIVCCDGSPGDVEGQWQIARDILKDPELAESIHAIGVHYPSWDKEIPVTDSALKTGKPLWSSEDQPNGGGDPIISREWPLGGRILAHLYNRNYLEEKFTATEIWSPITSYYDNLAAPNSGLMYANTPWSGYYNVQPTIWVTAHTTQFVQPGWQYLDTASGKLPDAGTYVTLRSPDSKDWSVILETINAKKSHNVSFRLAGGLTSEQLHIWLTNDTHTFEHVADINPVNGQWQYTFEPNSIYTLSTTTGQGKGAALPPPANPFPFPYEENFEQTPLGHTPKYLADQDGAFEVNACVGHSGNCLEQVITEMPIPWAAIPLPFTMAGDASWTDYRLAVDVLFLSKSPATLMGHIDSANVFQDGAAPYPSGFIFRVDPDGTWALLSTEFNKPTVTLASGKRSLHGKQWHKMQLVFRGSRVTAIFDGKPLTTFESSTHTHGMFAIGSGWDHIQFDNLSVLP